VRPRCLAYILQNIVYQVVRFKSPYCVIFFVNPKGGIRTKMKKLLKSRKALSPVVAAIILIAVTVAVSIAVAAWMGALTFTFMKTEEITNMSGTWGTDHVNITLSTRSDVVFTGAMVDDKPTTCYRSDTGAQISQTATYSVAKGNSVTIKVMNVGSANWGAGLPYKITILTSSSQYPWTGNANPS